MPDEPTTDMTIRAVTPCPAEVTITPAELVDLTIRAAELVSTMPDITSNEICVETREVLKEISSLRSEIDRKRSEVKAPFLAAGRIIDAQVKPLIERVDRCIAIVKKRLADYAMAVERRRLEAAHAVIAQETTARLEAAETGRTAIIPTVVIPDAAPIATRTEYVIRVVNITEVPAEFLTIKEDLVRAEFIAGRAVPGCVYEPVRHVVAR